MKFETLKEKLKKQSNDYSSVEKDFLNLTGEKLVNTINFTKQSQIKLKSLSIIIPYFNSSQSIFHTLNSIQKQQNIDFEDIEIIIIDDGSEKELKIKQKYSFRIKILRLCENKGRVRVRNIGLLLANYDVIMFLDADIILHENVLYNHLLVHSVLRKDNLLLVGFREWIKKEDKRIIKKNLRLNDIDLTFDHRIKITFGKRHLPFINNKKLLGKTIYIAKDTDYYKNLGNYKSYFDFKLYQQVHGFLFSIPLEEALKAGPAGETSKGWGSDDIMLTTKFIALGAKVIPLLNSMALHLHDINEIVKKDQKIEERKTNLKRFEQQLEEPFIEFVK